MELLTGNEILQMFRDFGLENEDQRQQLLSMTQAEPTITEGTRAQVFVRLESTTNPQEGADA